MDLTLFVTLSVIIIGVVIIVKCIRKWSNDAKESKLKDLESTDEEGTFKY